MSSTGRYDFGIVFTAHGASQVQGAVNRMNYSLAETERVGHRSNRSLGLMNRQLQAIGTTLRYAFAGSVIYGILNTGTAIQELQRQTASLLSVTELTRTSINDMMDDLQDTSIRVGISFESMVDSARAALSVFGKPLEADVATFIDKVVPVAGLIEADPKEMARLVGGTAASFGLDPVQQAGEISALLAKFQFESTTGSGQEIVSYFANVAQAAGFANISLTDTLALLEMVTRQGGTFASTSRWFRQLLTAITRPQGVKEEKAFESIGLSFERRQQLLAQPGGGVAILNTMINAIKAQGLEFAKKPLDDETIQMLEAIAVESGDPTNALASAGITGGGGDLLFKLSGGRIEGSLALARLMNEWESSTSAGKGGLEETRKTFGDINSILKEIADNLEESANVRTLDTLTQQAAAFRRELLEGVMPGVDAVATQLERLFKFGEDNPFALAGGGAAGILGLILGGKMLAGKGKGILGRLGGLAGGAGIAALSTGAPTGDFNNPYFVWVLNPGMGGGGIPVPGKPGTKTPGGKAPSRLTKVGTKLGKFLRFAGPASMAYLAYDFLFNTGDAGAPILPEIAALMQANPNANKAEMDKIINEYWRQQNAQGAGGQLSGLNRTVLPLAGQAGLGPFQGVLRAIEMTSRISSLAGGGGLPEGGQSLDLKIELTDEAKKLIRLSAKAEGRHVPATAWQGGAFPTSRGRQITWGSGL